MKSEVKPLEQAVCALVAKLEMRYHWHMGTEGGFSILNADDGIHIETPDHPNVGGDVVTVTIRPVGWPEGSYIHGRFIKHSYGWKLLERGGINAPHLDIRGVYFSPSDDEVGVSLDVPG